MAAEASAEKWPLWTMLVDWRGGKIDSSGVGRSMICLGISAAINMIQLLPRKSQD
jgi:hypothetical protein